MNHQVSPFAALSGAEKQIRWLEYQSIKLPYAEARIEAVPSAEKQAEIVKEAVSQPLSPTVPIAQERPQPPPEVPRTMPVHEHSRHSQYDAVIARLKQAELQAKRFSQAAQ